MSSSKRIVLTTAYKRPVLAYLEDSDPVRIRAVGDEPCYPIGTVVMARVKKMMPSSGACFVDIGDDTDYFLQIPADVSSLHFADEKQHSKVKPEDIIMVQVSNEAVKLKSPCVTGRISIHSRHLVIEEGRGVSFSSKIGQNDRRNIILPENISTYSSKYHIIVRTESKDVDDPAVFTEELVRLSEIYEHIISRSGTALVGNVLYHTPGYLESTLLDWLKYGCDEIVTDMVQYRQLLTEISEVREVAFRFYEDELLPLGKLYKLETCVDECLSRKVYLKNGAFLVIEQGETLTAIDVNSGHNIRGNKEETSFEINMNAADEILRQLRLRNISGMILIDYINMRSAEHVTELIRKTSSVLKNDDVLCRFIDTTGLGLFEITRKRVFKSFKEQWKGSD
ncbi:MAG: ribonuclease E/G [Lachnospiraceae bacterium]|nr:ribonuclease E/G [Lachnospiraceae bacterium]